jgi:multidrug efflux pump subunit AcrB
VDQIAKRDSRVVRLNWFLGESAPSFYYNVIAQRKNNANYAQALVQLETANSAQELVHHLHAELADALPGARLLVRQLEQGPPFDAPIEVRLFGPDLDELVSLGEHVRRVLTETPSIIHTRCELSESLPKLALRMDEEEARLADLTCEEIARQLQSTLEGSVGGSLLEETEELPVRVRLSNQSRARLAEIASLEFLPAGMPPTHRRHVPLTAMAQFSLNAERASIPHYNRRRMNEVEGFIPAGMLPANVLADFQQRLDESGFTLPPGYRLEIGGEAAERNESIGKLLSNIDVLLVLMLVTLVLALRSFRGAAIIALVGVLSVGSGLGALWLFGFPFGFMAIVGTMGLVGVAVNDSIVVMAALNSDERATRGDPVATREVVVRSTRHVVATSLTTMAGFTPLVLSGGGFWPPLATAIAGGVAGATALALYFVPSVHLMVMCLRSQPDTITPDSSAASVADEERQVVDACRDLLELQPASVPDEELAAPKVAD